MANIKSAEKRIGQAERRRHSNRSHRSRMRSAVRKLRAAIDGGDREQAQTLLASTLSLVDSTARKGIIHPNAAARTKSRLARAVQGTAS